ncbi:hypothetical protein [Sphingomonas quercus]|uniref:DUF3299 domain-containing protein n=1 Tax=Sphingomonas quercus TaxID=2842451 RepID=A0ABS6BQ30_9SPHN|nr:hypothetical protein [Sphingomonas quercus]MBU3079315.1 hypothetical protein [Sphingomonas quercus]
MRVISYFATIIAAGSALAAPAFAHNDRLAPNVPGTLSWDTLEETEAVEWTDAQGASHLKPSFPGDVAALDGTKVKLVGFPMALDEADAKQHRMLLFAAQPDCFFHMSPGPQRFVEARLSGPVSAGSEPIMLSGRMELVRADRGGVFYRLIDAQQVPIQP